MKIHRLIINQYFFTFNYNRFRQKFELPVGSPLSEGFACIFLEFLESCPFHKIIHKESAYSRYIDDTLLIYNHEANLSDLVYKLKKKKSNTQ